MKSRNISWKSYLILILRYLSLNKKYLWAGNLEIFIQNNKFASQYKYLSLFFYEDFKISSMPNISSFKNDGKYSFHFGSFFHVVCAIIPHLDEKINGRVSVVTLMRKKQGYC